MNSLFEDPSFFFRYHHYVVILVRSNTTDDHFEWRAVVESNIRNLIVDLNHNRYISFARLNSTYFDSTNENKSDSDSNATADQIIFTESPYCSMWFIGIEFEYMDIDLTEIMKDFTVNVALHAVKTNVLKDGMNLEIRLFKRKNLSQYLGVDFLECERRFNDILIRANYGTVTKHKRQQEESATKRSQDILEC